MPRTKLDPEYWRLYGRDYLRRNIANKRIAEIIGKTPNTVTKKCKDMTFTLEEFRKIIQVIGMSDDTILRIMK